jgi:predicted metal-dependent phosphoesterase TrpH
MLAHYAARGDVRVVAFTDHDAIGGAIEASRLASEYPERFGGIEVIVGEEVSSRDGHVLGLFLEDLVPPGMDALRTVEAIHAQGGIAVAPHPYTWLLRWKGLVGVGDLIHRIPFDAVETRNSNFTEFFANRRAERECAGAARLGSSDAHFPQAAARAYTEFPGRSAEDLRRAILEQRTRAGGGVYGAWTLACYTLGRMLAAKPILPRRVSVPVPDDSRILVSASTSPSWDESGVPTEKYSP